MSTTCLRKIKVIIIIIIIITFVVGVFETNIKLVARISDTPVII